MKYVRLGRTGLEVSRICLGCMSFGNPNMGRAWVLPEDDSRPLMKAAWEAGINFYDTANVYSAGTSEEITGKLLKELSPNRDDYVLATKVHGQMREGPNGKGLSRKAILSEIDHSLQRLKLDYVDLYQIHRFDPKVPIEETLEPRPLPGGSNARALSGPRTSKATSRASSSKSRCRRKNPESPSLPITRSSSVRRRSASARCGLVSKRSPKRARHASARRRSALPSSEPG